MFLLLNINENVVIENKIKLRDSIFVRKKITSWVGTRLIQGEFYFFNFPFSAKK